MSNYHSALWRGNTLTFTKLMKIDLRVLCVLKGSSFRREVEISNLGSNEILFSYNGISKYSYWRSLLKTNRINSQADTFTQLQT